MTMLQQCLNLEGDAAECGVAFGRTAFVLDPVLLAAGKKLLAFDTFSGLPYNDSIKSPHQCKQGEFAKHGEEFFMTFNTLKQTSIQPVRGLVEETLIQFSSRKFCFVWLDMDLYVPTSFAYKFFEDRIVKGGIIGFHDYQFIRCPGVEIVVDKEVDYSKFEKIFLKDSCIFLKRL